MVFRLLQSLFTATPNPSGKFDAALIRAAIERVVDGTDPRLRIVHHYQRKLWPAVEHALGYVVDFVDALPPAVEIGRRHFTADPQLRALFASPEHLQEVLSFGASMRAYLQETKGLPPDALYAVLRMERVEKTVLGLDLQGDMVRRDVPQTVINFHNHRLTFPSGSETKTRREIKKRSFDYLIETALQQLLSVRTQRQQLEQQQRQLLQKKIKSLHAAQPGLESLLASTTPDMIVSTATIERQLQEIGTKLSQIRADSATLEQHLAKVASTLKAPEHYLRQEQVSLTLDHMNIKISKDSPNAANKLMFNDILLGKNRRITTLIVRFPGSELLPQPDFFEEAHRLLYLNSHPRLTTI